MTENREIWFHANSTNVDFFLASIKSSEGWEPNGEPRRVTRDGTDYLVYDATRGA